MFTITEKAINEFKGILSGPDMPEEAGLRVFAQSGGCCTPNQLGVEVADMSVVESPGLDFSGLKVLIDADVAQVAENATIDFFDNPEAPGFRVLWKKNDMIEGGCGCGCG
jgi:Fe-S cluster assembly iron-binding protein IscA